MTIAPFIGAFDEPTHLDNIYDRENLLGGGAVQLRRPQMPLMRR